MDNFSIYLPISDFNTYSCYEVRDKDTVRAYRDTPRLNSSTTYVDYFITSNYLQKEGSISWGNYATLPVCVDKNILTNDYYYSFNFANTLLIAFLIGLFVIYLPYKIVARLFGRWLKI